MTIATFAILAIPGCRRSGIAEERSSGELSFRRSCQSCHSLPKPAMKTDEEWLAIVERYGQRAKLSASTRQEILQYLVASN